MALAQLHLRLRTHQPTDLTSSTPPHASTIRSDLVGIRYYYPPLERPREERPTYVLREPLSIKQLGSRGKDYLQINVSPASSGGARGGISSSTTESHWEPTVVEWEESRTLQLKAIGGSHWVVERDSRLDAVRPDSWDLNISFNHLSSTAVGWRQRRRRSYIATHCLQVATQWKEVYKSSRWSRELRRSILVEVRCRCVIVSVRNDYVLDRSCRSVQRGITRSDYFSDRSCLSVSRSITRLISSPTARTSQWVSGRELLHLRQPASRVPDREQLRERLHLRPPRVSAEKHYKKGSHRRWNRCGVQRPDVGSPRSEVW